jgi:hypothetical protein
MKPILAFCKSIWYLQKTSIHLQPKGKWFQFSPLKIIQSHAELATHPCPPPTPLCKGGQGGFLGDLFRGKMLSAG